MEPTDPAATPENVLPVDNDREALLAGLSEENEALRAQLEEVVATAATNERIWRHFAEIERILFRTRELDVLVEELLGELKERFQTDQVILFLCHPDILERFFPDLSESREPVSAGTWIVSLPVEIGMALWNVSPKPFLLSEENIEELLEYLPESASPVRSGVMIPLSIHEILFGGLFLGSMDADRYRPRDGTDLLEQLGIKIALAMDNCLTYEKVKDFGIEDPVTGLLNFFQVHTVLEREFRRSRRTGQPLSLLIIDFNFVHELEDFDSGTEVLKHVAGLLSGILPEKESFLGRYGSDEFVLVLPGVEEEEAREVIPYLARTIRKAPFKHRNTAILIQAMIGTATLDDGMKRPQEMLDSAYAELARLKAVHHPEPAEE
ncbi:MAG TPA: sensor domain-containing diguanylate cyclase [Syntrophobacter fumaroxidans]|nr:sensor domain-containing diguanylate cyclase [Syntrophobacter fumaroxidans]